MDNLDNLENQAPAHAEVEAADLQEQVESLRHLVISLLVLLFVVSGTFNLFLLRQVKYTRLDLNAVRPQVSQLISEYNKNSAPAIDKFLRQLSDYGRTHPDIVPILTKYGIRPASAAPSAAVPGASTPPVAPQKK